MAPPKTASKLARPAAIYRRGKQAAPASDSGSSDEEGQEEEEGDDVQEDGDEPRPATRTMDVDIGGVSLVGNRPNAPVEDSDSDTSDSEAGAPAVHGVSRPSGGASSDSDSSDEESSSEEDAPAPIYKPVFISKRNRDTVVERENDAGVSEEAERKRQELLEERKKQSHDLVAHTLKRELAEKETDEKFPDVDDTDGLDVEGEFEAWKLRELKRIQRDREAMLERERERDELERRRAIPEAMRLQEDTERAEKSRNEKPKGAQGFLQKYHHKGAFYTDSDILKKHDYTAPTEGAQRMDLLPAVMQVRDFGKMSRSKWTHLSKEDTTSADAGWNAKTGAKGGSGSGCFNCGGAHLKRDCPQSQGQGADSVTGSNGSALGRRQERGPDEKGRGTLKGVRKEL